MDCGSMGRSVSSKGQVLPGPLPAFLEFSSALFDDLVVFRTMTCSRLVSFSLVTLSAAAIAVFSILTETHHRKRENISCRQLVLGSVLNNDITSTSDEVYNSDNDIISKVLPDEEVGSALDNYDIISQLRDDILILIIERVPAKYGIRI
ncbi:hypothetical protein ABFS82_09G042800 [Erythranthe guttata]